MKIDHRITNFFKELNIYDENFFEFIDNKIVYLESGSDILWYGCHPILKDNIIKDIRLVVPVVKTEKDLLINIHEITHALELYNELEKEYQEKRELREQKAKKMEEIYFLKKLNKCS